MNRYQEQRSILSVLDPMADVLNLVSYLRVTDHLVDLLVRRHGLPHASAKRRSKRVVPHVETALEYVEQCLAGPEALSFLPAYYAVLNMMKVYILAGPHHEALPRQSWHGATYDGYAKDSHSVMTETIALKTGGAIPLFYATVTGARYQKDVSMKMRDVYPYIVDVGAEYTMVEGNNGRLCAFDIGEATGRDGQKHAVLRFVPFEPTDRIAKNQLKLLKGRWERVKASHLTYRSPPLGTDVQDLDRAVRSWLKPHLIYHWPDEKLGITPINGRLLEFPEELPIALAFFHMSSVVRYKPEFLARLRDSRHWPMLSAARRHCLLKFLVLFWSFMHKETLVLTHGE